MAIILASQSPRRRELLYQMGLTQFTIRPALGEEIADPGLTPALLVEALSCQKAEEVAGRSDPGDLIIAADTVVALDGAVLGKPADEEEAFRMLSLLSGNRHQVYTGLTVLRGEQAFSVWEETAVTFRSLTGEEIERYIATGEPMDKAGAYGIQGYGALLIEGITGDYYNVMGLPVCRLGRILSELGVDCLALAAGT